MEKGQPKVITAKADLQSYLNEKRKLGLAIGFVPTMGALHEGHASLMKQAREACDVVVVSIFVNPTQFNNPADFEAYPLTPEKDLKLLADVGCDVLFMPLKEEIYSADYHPPKLDLGIYDQVMEGHYRPGHFKGVVQVVYRLFDLIQPDFAYFGLKDYQQVAVIRKMVEHFKLPVKLVACPTVRETDGLALSSRNLRLSASERKEALFIYQSLMKAQDLSARMSPDQVKAEMENTFANSSLRLEYFEVIHPDTFETLHDHWVVGAVACVVAYCGEVRLIDNMLIKD